jgi:hypothetical protein
MMPSELKALAEEMGITVADVANHARMHHGVANHGGNGHHKSRMAWEGAIQERRHRNQSEIQGV